METGPLILSAGYNYLSPLMGLWCVYTIAITDWALRGIYMRCECVSLVIVLAWDRAQACAVSAASWQTIAELHMDLVYSSIVYLWATCTVNRSSV